MQSNQAGELARQQLQATVELQGRVTAMRSFFFTILHTTPFFLFAYGGSWSGAMIYDVVVAMTLQVAGTAVVDRELAVAPAFTTTSCAPSRGTVSPFLIKPLRCTNMGSLLVAFRTQLEYPALLSTHSARPVGEVSRTKRMLRRMPRPPAVQRGARCRPVPRCLVWGREGPSWSGTSHACSP